MFHFYGWLEFKKKGCINATFFNKNPHASAMGRA